MMHIIIVSLRHRILTVLILTTTSAECRNIIELLKLEKYVGTINTRLEWSYLAIRLSYGIFLRHVGSQS